MRIQFEAIRVIIYAQQAPVVNIACQTSRQCSASMNCCGDVVNLFNFVFHDLVGAMFVLLHASRVICFLELCS